MLLSIREDTLNWRYIVHATNETILLSYSQSLNL